jgi:predicted nucleic acid-binding protein
MGPFVLDASLTLSWCFADEASEFSSAALRHLSKSFAIVPAVWPFEVANVLAIAEKRQRITPTGVDDFLEVLRRLPIQIERRDATWICQSVLPLSRAFGLSAYDAAYLELAKREDLPIATLDQNLVKVAGRIGVPSFAV